MNVLTKTCRGFVKRVAAYIVAGTVAATLITAAVSAEKTAVAPTLWETVNVLDMDGFTKKDGSDIWHGFLYEKTENGRNYNVNGMPGGQWVVHGDTRMTNELSPSVAENLPDIAKNNAAFVLARSYINGYPDNVPASDSSIVVENLFDTSKLEIGDKIKITAYVNARTLATRTKNPNNTSRYIINTDNISGDINYRIMLKGAADERVEIRDNAEEWKAISLEYVINSTNKAINSIKIDNKVAEGEVYPLNLYLAGVKVEKQIKTDTVYKKTVASINMDGFPEKGGSIWGYKAEKTVNGKTYGVKTDGGGGKWVVHSNSAIRDLRDFEKAGLPPIAGSKVATVKRGWVSDVNATVDSKAGIVVTNLFDDSNVAVGDKIKITAYVRASQAYNDKDILDDQPVNFRAYVNKPWVSDSETGYNTDATVSDISFEGKLPIGRWNAISIEYTVTEENMAARCIKVDNKKSEDGIYPLELCLAGVTVEKLENGGWYTADANGNASGEIYANNTGVSEGSKLIVAAYEGDTFMGCDILDANGEVSPFSVTGAAKADKVCAYVWDMTTLKPQAGIIGLTKAE